MALHFFRACKCLRDKWLSSSTVEDGLKPVFHAIGDQFTVWDYSVRNMERLRPIGVTRSVHVPIGYVPELSRIDAAADQNIDVLFYGLVEQRRGRVLKALMDAGLTVKVLQGVYGAERDKYIARSKVVLNMHLYEARIFEVARVSYLLANAKAVVSECGEHTEIEDGFRDALYAALHAVTDAPVPVVLGGPSLVTGGLLALIEIAWAGQD